MSDVEELSNNLRLLNKDNLLAMLKIARKLLAAQQARKDNERKDIVETILCLCNFVNLDRLNKIWDQAYKLSMEQMAESEKASPSKA
jgi:hypothetical protein